MGRAAFVRHPSGVESLGGIVIHEFRPGMRRDSTRGYNP